MNITITHYIVASVIQGVMVAVFATQVRESAVFMALMILALFQILTAVMFYRHQKALEWFQNHVRLETSKLPDNAPKDMGRKDDEG